MPPIPDDEVLVRTGYALGIILLVLLYLSATDINAGDVAIWDSLILGKKRYAVPKWQRGKAFVKAKVAGTEWDLRLYVAGLHSRSVTAIRNLERLCDEHCAGHYKIEIVDLLENPQRAQDDQILALPALVRKGIFPSRKIIGTLADAERVLASLVL